MNVHINPLVSVIIPAYNRTTLICETLDSLLTQSYINWECIIVDDGSIDDTKNVVKTYVDKDCRFKLFDRPAYHKPGGNGARNFGFEVCKGEYIQWLDSDDLLHPDKIGSNVKKLSNKPETALCFSKTYFFNSSHSPYLGNPSMLKDYPNPVDYAKDYCRNGSGFNTDSIFAHKSLVEKSGGWNEEVLKNQDGEFIIRLVINSSEILFDNDSIVYYRINPDGKRANYVQKDGMEDLKTVKLIISNIQSIPNFYDSNLFCSTLLGLLKFEFPNKPKLWNLIDAEIKKTGGKIIYSKGNKKFLVIWRIFGLNFALRFFNLKKKILKILFIA
jgi:glycosyltransferase involved in cell wall biosynthesis